MFIILLFRLFLSAKVSKWKNNMALVLFLKKKTDFNNIGSKTQNDSTQMLN